MAVMVTGHRKIVPPNLVGSEWPDQNPAVAQHHRVIKSAMAGWIMNEYYGSGETEFISGMALGADQLFAETVLELRASGVPVHLVAAVPFKGQESNWPASSQAKWQALMAQASFIQYVCDPGYASWKMQKRNEWMVDNSNRALAIWNGLQKGGTWNCIGYAKRQGKPIFGLHPTNVTFSVLE